MNLPGHPPIPPAHETRGLCAGCLASFPARELRLRDDRPYCATCLERMALAKMPAPPAAVAFESGWRRWLTRLSEARVPLALGRAGAYLLAFAVTPTATPFGWALAMPALLGVYAADNLTWIVFRTLELPTALRTYPVEVLIAGITGGALISWHGAVPVPSDAYGLGIAFPAFLLALAFKTFLWTGNRANED